MRNSEIPVCKVAMVETWMVPIGWSVVCWSEEASISTACRRTRSRASLFSTCTVSVLGNQHCAGTDLINIDIPANLLYIRSRGVTSKSHLSASRSID